MMAPAGSNGLPDLSSTQTIEVQFLARQLRTGRSGELLLLVETQREQVAAFLREKRVREKQTGRQGFLRVELSMDSEEEPLGPQPRPPEAAPAEPAQSRTPVELVKTVFGGTQEPAPLHTLRKLAQEAEEKERREDSSQVRQGELFYVPLF